MKILTKISYLFLITLFLFATASCEKDKEDLPVDELLMSHSWKWNKMTTTSTNENIQNTVALVNALMTGATLEFSDDGTFTITALNTSDDGTWELPDDETLFMDDDEMTITKLTDSELILEGEEETESDGTYIYNMYWKK
jgi:hypothetical protein